MVLVSDHWLVSKVSSPPPLGKSDRVVVHCCLTAHPTVLPPSTRLRHIWSFDSVDIEKMNCLLQELDWSQVSGASSMDEAWQMWKSLFLSVVLKHVPSKLIGRVRSRPPSPLI